MGKCLKGKSTAKKGTAKVKCARCGALSEDKKAVCCAEKTKQKDAKKSADSADSTDKKKKKKHDA
jgi:hypothetical protein